MNFNFDRVISREGTNAVKLEWRKQLFGNEGVIPMWVADMEFEVPPFITEALHARTRHPIYGYSVLPDSYYQSIINWQKRRYGWDIHKDWLFFSPGVVTALNLLVEAFTDPGDTVIVQPPVYFPFFWAVERHNRVLAHNRLQEENNAYHIDFDDLERKMRSGARMLIMCSPHNPVGRAWGREEMERIGSLCLEHDVLLLSDEIHGDLVMPGQKHIPMATLSEELSQKTITCIAPSKTFNLAGLFTSSIIIANEELRARYKAAEEKVHLSPNIFGAVASEAAYTHGEVWLNEMLEYVNANALFARETLQDRLPAVRTSPLEATYLLWLDFRALGVPDEEVARILVEKAGLGLSPGRMFGPGGEGFQRMNIGCPRSVVEDAIERIIRAFR